MKRRYHNLTAALSLAGYLVLCAPASAVEVPCTAGFAGAFPCSNVDLKATLPNNVLAGGGTGADIWGWTDSTTGKEYAVMSHSLTTSFTDITDPENPIYLGFLQSPAINALWRDVKVYRDHAYVVGDLSPGFTHGLQIFDLTQLRGETGTPPKEFPETNVYTGVPGNMFNENHNIWINEESGYGYLLGGNSCGGGMHVIDLQPDPANPVFVSCIDTSYVHDAVCVNYHGPDPDHQGKEICFNSDATKTHVIDVTDKFNPVMLSQNGYMGSGYVHQGALTQDHKYYLSNDEGDETSTGNNTHTYLWDIRDLDNVIQMPTFVGTTPAIDHNMYVRGQYLFQSNYTAGLRIIDISDIANGNLSEVAYFDTHPSNDVNEFAGTWSNYPFFPSGTVIVSNLEEPGLFILETNLPPDADGDYWADANDNCVSVANADQLDGDQDGVGDACDNCTLAANASQCDTNNDGFGNHCDADLDNNNIVNSFDLTIMRNNFGTAGINDSDLNCNNIVNSFDLTIMRDSFGAAPGPSAFAPPAASKK